MRENSHVAVEGLRKQTSDDQKAALLIDALTKKVKVIEEITTLNIGATSTPASQSITTPVPTASAPEHFTHAVHP